MHLLDNEPDMTDTREIVAFEVVSWESVFRLRGS